MLVEFSPFASVFTDGYVSWLRWPSWNDIRGIDNSLIDKPRVIEMNYTSSSGLNITSVHLKIRALCRRAGRSSWRYFSSERFAVWLRAGQFPSYHLPNRDGELPELSPLIQIVN